MTAPSTLPGDSSKLVEALQRIAAIENKLFGDDDL